MKNINEKLDHLLSKINWGASFLDAEAIEIMNTIGDEIQHELRLEYLKGVRDGSMDYSEKQWTDSDIIDMMDELDAWGEDECDATESDIY